VFVLVRHSVFSHRPALESSLGLFFIAGPLGRSAFGPSAKPTGDFPVDCAGQDLRLCAPSSAPIPTGSRWFSSQARGRADQSVLILAAAKFVRIVI
jgi:hypothetical protein